MSYLKENTFNQILNCFVEEEEENDEEEIYDFEQNNNNFYNSNPHNTNLQIQNEQNKAINNNNNSIYDKQKQIFTEIYSNFENNDDNVYYCDERKLNDMKGEEFNNFKVISFRPSSINEEQQENDFNMPIEDEKESQNNNIKNDEKNKINNWLINSNNEENNQNDENESKKEIIYNKIINDQGSFKNINEASNRSTSLYTDKLGEIQQSTFIQDNIEQEMFKPQYLINSKSFDEIENKNNIQNNNNNNNIIESINDKNQNIKNSINKKELVKNNKAQLKKYMNQKTQKKTNYKSKSKSKSKSKTKNIKKISRRRNNIDYKTFNNVNKKPIELILYDEALKKKEKIESISKNNLTEIKLNSTKTKINKKSYQIALELADKKIESIVNKYSDNNNISKEALSIIDICLIFQSLKLFRTLLQNININKLANNNNMNEFKEKISITIKAGENRKNEELEFLEQTWGILNPEQKNGIRKDIFEGFLKIMFLSTGNIQDIVNILRQYLQAALFGEGIVPLNDGSKKDDSLKLKNYVKQFFKLKENMIAYQKINNYNGIKHEKLLNEKNKNFTFEPNIPQNENFRETTTERKKNFNFNSLYNRFIEKEKNKQSNLNHLKQKKIKEELKELKQKPTINKNINIDNNFFPINNYPQDVHEKLYKLDKDLRQKRQKKIDEKIKEDQEQFEKEFKNHKLNINSKENRRRMNKSFDNKVRPKGYDDYVTRNKKAILEKIRIKTMIEKIPNGENYEKLKRRSITPFNITDMRKKNKDKKKGNEDYITLQIKIPNGKLKTIKIDMKSNPYKIADNFCKIYSIKDNIKKKLIKNIIECQRAYLNSKKFLEMEEEEELEDEDQKIEK